MNKIVKKENQLTLQSKYKAISVKNEIDVFNSNTKALCLMKPEIGEVGLKALVSYAVADLVKFFNIGKTMTPEQIAQTAEFIIEDFYMLKIEDIKLCFNRAKKGEYGQLYDRLDGQIILSWISKYFNNRLNIAEAISQREHLETKQSFLNTSERLKEESHKRELEAFKLKTNYNRN